MAGSIYRKSLGYCGTVSKYEYPTQSAGQLAADIEMAVIARAAVTAVRLTVDTAE